MDNYYGNTYELINYVLPLFFFFFSVLCRVSRGESPMQRVSVGWTLYSAVAVCYRKEEQLAMGGIRGFEVFCT